VKPNPGDSAKSKDGILAALRRAKTAELPHPGSFFSKVPEEARFERFASLMQSVGGSAEQVTDMPELQDRVQLLTAAFPAARVCCCVDGVSAGSLRLADVSDEKSLAELDVAVVPATLAVCENAAVWIDPQGLRYRSVLFLAQHLIAVVPAFGLVADMHEAYRRLDYREHASAYFISGPTKTADIEQNLVIGAQGPRSMHVIVFGGDGMRDGAHVG
jgi:L-lactate dehydrogenase complex protein LldG